MLTPGTILLKKIARYKSGPLCGQIDLPDANLKSALIRFQNWWESIVSTSVLDPTGTLVSSPASDDDIDQRAVAVELSVLTTSPSVRVKSNSEEIDVPPDDVGDSPATVSSRSSWTRRPPDRYGDATPYAYCSNQ